ncbi:phosphorylase family protein [Streptomyces mirabilis]|uniref:phosphorylase family protein n=1 Tax=Streptomyces mirabilis TaxID=68239 RepID=UPI0037FAACE9
MIEQGGLVSSKARVPDEQWRQRARMTLLGCDWRGREVVLTPIRSIYAALAHGGTECDGWWRTSLIGDAAVVHIPQGTAAKDIVFALPQPTRITFVGLAGGLRNQPIGTTVDPESAFIAEPSAGTPSQSMFPAGSSFHARSHPAESLKPGGVAATVGCLADSTLLHHRLASTADCVDMESAHLFSAAAIAGHQMRCLLVISDHNRDGDVFTSTPEQIAPAVDDLCQSIQEDLTGGQ